MLYKCILKCFISKVFICNLFLSVIFCLRDELAYSMIKELNGQIYVGGANFLRKCDFLNNKLNCSPPKIYQWESFIMNGSTTGFSKDYGKLPSNFSIGPNPLSYDTCLNWKQEHINKSVRETDFDFHHWKYHTPSGDWITMNFTCMNSFIRNIERFDNEQLWVCGTFGAFPRAFTVNTSNLNFTGYVDVNLMSCARYMDEPMVTYKDGEDLYVGSGWGLYRPDKTNPDVPNNNSTMLYADWRLNTNLFTLPSSMAWVLSSDVNFINVVKSSTDHLYFFGYEISNQYGLNNQEDRHAWQSFMLRICRKDLGFKYIPTDILTALQLNMGLKYDSIRFNTKTSYEDYIVSGTHIDMDFSEQWYDKTAHLPKTHFVTPQKINFGCYIGKRPRAISSNHFWGDTNVVYLNKLADVIFDPNRVIKFRTKHDSHDECTDMMHHQIPLVGIFNREGLLGTSVGPTGALCQLQINQNIFNEIGSSRNVYQKRNFLNAENAYKEAMAFSSTSYSNFYSRSLHRTNGFTLYPYWNQGVLIGDNLNRPYYKTAFDNIGKCNSASFYKNMNGKSFLQIQNFTNTGWPNELPNRLTSMTTSVCQYPAAELYSFNASFVIPGVEFKKLFLIKDNITDYAMSEIFGIKPERVLTSPLMIVGIISTSGIYYRVVLCDFDNAIVNHGEIKNAEEWYNWCIFRYTDQPYLYRQYIPMERRKWGQSYQFRASSLLVEKRIVTDADTSSFSIKRDPQFNVIKDVLRINNTLLVLTTNRFFDLSLEINCNDYSQCIDCASDPECMWNRKNKQCIKYKHNEFNNSEYLQDVLDRGFKCISEIDNSSKIITNIENFSNNNPMNLTVFRCLNAGFWRGKIQWKINSLDVSNDSSQYLIDSTGNYLTVSFSVLSRYLNFTVSCHGIKDDNDTLIHGLEYKWIKKTYSDVLLMKYYFTMSTLDPKWNCYHNTLGFLIMFIILLVIVIIVQFYFLMKRKKKSRLYKIDHHPLHKTQSADIRQYQDQASLM